MTPVIFAVKGQTLSQEEKDFFKKVQPQGYIIFGFNIETTGEPDYIQNHDKLKKLIADLRALHDYKIDILVDQEGGRVARIRKPALEPEDRPSAEFFREIAEGKYFVQEYKDISKTQRLKLKKIEDSNTQEPGWRTTNIDDAAHEVYAVYYNITKKLLELGIDGNCAPMADMLHEGADDIVGDRSFGKSVDMIVRLATSAMEAIYDAGGRGMIKHIPGHGRATADSHKELPYVDAPLEELNKTDFEVFRQLAKHKVFEKGARQFWAMTAHIVYKAIDHHHPITQSKEGLEFIRENIGFKAPIISDTIDMQALSGSYTQRTKGCLEAGIDIVLHCTGNIDEMIEIAEAFKEFGTTELA